MKKHWKALTGLLVCFAILATGVVGFFKSNNMLMEESKRSAVAANLSGSLKEDDFVVLEIVPDKSYAQLGYLQEGSEPIDILEACKDGKAAEIAKIAGNGVQLKKTIDGNTYKRLSEVYENMDEYWEKTVSGSSIQSNNKYTFVGGNSFVMNKNTLANAFASKVGTDEEIKVKTVTANELNGATEDELKALLDKVDFIYVSESYVQDAGTEQKELAKKYAKGDINVDKTFASDNYDADWKVVNTIFKYVGNKENPMPIMMDQTIYKDGNLATKNVSTKQYALNRDVKYNEDTKDSWKVSGSSDEKENLFHKTDYNAGSDKAASNNNMYKLYLMTMFRDPAEFYNLFVESGLVDGGTYALQSGDAAKYWNTYTFLPCKKEIKYSNHEKGDEDFWKDEMAITLAAKDGKWVNCNAISFEKNTSASFVDSKKEINTVFNYKPKSCMDGRTYNVLELQPARSFALTEAEIEQMLPYTSYSKVSSLKLKITKMTTSEFVGKIDTLASKYDMIYIGKEIGGFHTENGETYFGSINNDMKGIIYAHSGAKVTFDYGNPNSQSSSNAGSSNGYAFFAKGESGRLRYAGNDITELKKNELKTYLDTGLPIVVADGLISDAMEDDPEYFDVYPDNNNVFNNMREFLKANKADLLSLDYNYRDATEKEQEKLSRLTKRKPTLTINSLTAGGNSYSDLSKCNVYKFKKTDENRRFTFSYKVDNSEASNADFVLNLYVDKNADGRFVSTERVGGKSFKANGNNSSYTFSMNPNYSGAFTWKLEVYPRNNPGMKCSQVGYSTIRFTDVTEKQTVYVLQVQAVKGNLRANSKLGEKHATEWGYNKAQQIDLSKSTYLKAKEVTDDYDIKIIVTDLQHFTYGVGENESSNGSWWDDVRKERHSRKDLKNKYHMIIFGFADSYRDMEFNDEKIAKDIQDYIDDGKSVLFTHDLTSQINNSSIWGDNDDEKDWSSEDASITKAYMETTNGKGFNRWMRDAMGLDRYNQGKRVGSTEQCKKYTTTGTNELKYGFTYTSLMQYSNFRRNWNTGGKNRITGWFGPYNHLYINLLARNNNESGDDAGKGWPYIGIQNDSASTPEDGNAYVTSRVTKVNDGQITKYPFDLSEYENSDGTYNISKTHGQAYQLNVESDDVVCWFALSDKANSKGTGWYSASPNDVSNNYYIYNKGNVTYTGVGHSTLSDMSDFEEKLFVNTIIAALRAGVEGPQPQITNGYNIPEGAEDRYVIYADVDADSEDKEFDKTEDVEFYAMDDSTKSKYVYVSLAVEKKDSDGNTVKVEKKDDEGNVVKDDDGNIVYETVYEEVSVEDGFTLAGSDVQGPMSIENDKGEQHTVWRINKTDLTTNEDGIKYTIKYPRAVLEKSSSQNFKIYAYSYEGSGKYKIKGYQCGALMRQALFKLD